jgi:hypothetical protein
MLADFGVQFDPVHGLLYDVLPRALKLVMWLAGHDVSDGNGQF